MDKLTEHQIFEEKRLLEMESSIKDLKNEVALLSQDVSDLVSAWKAANWLVGLVKWVGGVAVAITAIVTLVKGIK